MDDRQMKKEIRGVSNRCSLVAPVTFGVSFIWNVVARFIASIFCGSETDKAALCDSIGSFGSILGMLAFVILFYCLFGQKTVVTMKAAFCRPRRPVGTIIKWGVILFGLSLSAMEAMILLLSLFDKTAVTNNTGTSGSVWLTVLTVSLLGPVTEELAFRFAVCRGCEPMGQRFSIIFSSLMFGLLHANPVQAVYTFIMGIGLSLIYLKTRSLIPCILIHIILNAVGALETVCGVIALDLYAFSDGRPAQIGANVFSLMMMSAAALLFVTELIRRRGKISLSGSVYPLTKSRRLGVFFSAPVTVIALVMAVSVTILSFVQQYLM